MSEALTLLARDFANVLPAHKCGLYLEHNSHRDMYESVEQWEENMLSFDGVEPGSERDWISAEERQKAIETDSVWTLQWYPNTPVAFCRLWASSLEALLAHIATQDFR